MRQTGMCYYIAENGELWCAISYEREDGSVITVDISVADL